MIAKSSKLRSSRDGFLVSAKETRRKERETGGKSDFNETKSPGGRKKAKLSTESMSNTSHNIQGSNLDTPSYNGITCRVVESTYTYPINKLKKREQPHPGPQNTATGEATTLTDD
jgi:hypothetical protein